MYAPLTAGLLAPFREIAHCETTNAANSIACTSGFAMTGTRSSEQSASGLPHNGQNANKFSLRRE
jgi:hypothetical protein